MHVQFGSESVLFYKRAVWLKLDGDEKKELGMPKEHDHVKLNVLEDDRFEIHSLGNGSRSEPQTLLKKSLALSKTQETLFETLKGLVQNSHSAFTPQKTAHFLAIMDQWQQKNLSNP